MEELLSDTVVQSSEFILDSYAPSRTKCRVILLLIYIYIAGFDSISDLIAWGSFLKIGFGHPLLPTPLLWSFVWGLFALTGLVLAMMSTSHEIMRLFHLKESFCRSHVELILVAGLLLEDVPMLVMASLYGLSQYTCSTGSIMASSDALVPILISSVGTALATFWRLMLTLLHFRSQGQKKISRRGTRKFVNSPVHNRDLSNGDKTGSSLTPGISDMTTKAPNGENRTLTKAVGTLAVEMTPKGRHSSTNWSGLSTSRCSLKWWLQNCYKVFIFLFGLAICVLSILVVVGVIYLMVEQNPLLVHQPRDPLMIFTSSNSAPWPHPLVNVSNVIDNDRVTLMYESRCQLVFKYQAKQHRIVYNFADINVSGESIEAKRSSSEREKNNEKEKGEWCEERLSDLFYGSYRDRESGGGGDVEVFHELCLAVHLVLPPVTAEPVRDPGLKATLTSY